MKMMTIGTSPHALNSAVIDLNIFLQKVRTTYEVLTFSPWINSAIRTIFIRCWYQNRYTSLFNKCNIRISLQERLILFPGVGVGGSMVDTDFLLEWVTFLLFLTNISMGCNNVINRWVDNLTCHYINGW